MLNPFIELIDAILGFYRLMIIVWVIMSLLISFEIINQFSPIVKRIKYTLDRLIEPALNPIRRFLRRLFGDMGGIDLSPILLIFLIQFISSALYNWFWDL